jgi:nicotinamidase-related amidase
MTVTVEPDWDSIALISLLWQEDTLKELPPKLQAQFPESLKKHKALLEKFRQAGAPILHTVRLTYKNKQNVDYWRRDRYGSHYVIHSQGVQLLQEMLPSEKGIDLSALQKYLIDGNILALAPKEYLLYQPRLGAFYYTALNEFLETNRITSLVISSPFYPLITLPTLLEACERDYKLVVPTDLALGKHTHDKELLKELQVYQIEGKDIPLLPSLHTVLKGVNMTFFHKIEYTLGPIIGGMLLDSVSFMTMGRLWFLGPSLGLILGYWICRIYRLSQWRSFALALLAGIYCSIPQLGRIPLATFLTAYIRFSSPRFRT